jgi:hypothetical protein
MFHFRKAEASMRHSKGKLYDVKASRPYCTIHSNIHVILWPLEYRRRHHHRHHHHHHHYLFL